MDIWFPAGRAAAECRFTKLVNRWRLSSHFARSNSRFACESFPLHACLARPPPFSLCPWSNAPPNELANVFLSVTRHDVHRATWIQSHNSWIDVSRSREGTPTSVSTSQCSPTFDSAPTHGQAQQRRPSNNSGREGDDVGIRLRCQRGVQPSSGLLIFRQGEAVKNRGPAIVAEAQKL